MRGWPLGVLLSIACHSGPAIPAFGQTPDQPTQPIPPDPTEPPPGETAGGPARPGRYRWGALYVTPRFHVGPIGFDTNVFYTATDHQPDFMITAGPGLDLILPVGSGGQVYAKGNLDYIYFVRSASERRLTGVAWGGFEFKGARTELGAEERYSLTFARPSYEVNDRIEQEQESTEARLSRRLVGRLGIGLKALRAHNVTESTDYLGVDLGTALTYDLQQAEGELTLALSVKTQFVAGAAAQRTRYPGDPGRDSDRWLYRGGFRTDPTALISGRAIVGLRYYELEIPQAPVQELFYADVDAVWNISKRTRLGATYTRDITDSIFIPETGTPTNRVETIGARLEKDLTSRVDMRLYYRIVRSRSDGEITVDIPDEGEVTSVRNDDVREGGIDLGYRFRPNFRIAVVASYTDRNSTIDYFGVEGLLVGLNAQFNPD
jgi:hypothetical protein